MKKAEKVVVTAMSPAFAAEAQLCLKDMVADKVVLTLEPTELEKAKDTWNMFEDKKVEFGVAHTEIGTGLFKKGRLSLAFQRYQKKSRISSTILITSKRKTRPRSKSSRYASLTRPRDSVRATWMTRTTMRVMKRRACLSQKTRAGPWQKTKVGKMKGLMESLFQRIRSDAVLAVLSIHDERYMERRTVRY